MSKLHEFPAMLKIAGTGVVAVLGAVVLTGQHGIGLAIGPNPAAAEVAAEIPAMPSDAATEAPAEAVTDIAADGQGPSGLGRPALAEEVAAWDVAVLPDGTGLPVGSGDVLTGEEVFAEACAACHGEFAEGLDSWPVLAGGAGSLTDTRPVKTIGSYWPHLSTVYDYIHRSMPFGAAQTLSADDTYAITAFLLYSNGLVEDDFVLTNENFTTVTLPNADGFVVDDRPDTEYAAFSVEPCTSDCRTDPPQVTKRAVDLNVTPTDADGKPAGTLPDLRVADAEAAPAAAGADEDAALADVTPTDADANTTGDDPALIAAGEAVFRKCAACHKIGEGAKNGTGPHLTGIVGRTAGTVDGFKYSPALTKAAEEGLVWDGPALDGFLADPKGYLPKNRMSFAGLKNAEERAAVIAYLGSIGD